jgi:translation initiation factor 3 subunit E
MGCLVTACPAFATTFYAGGGEAASAALEAEKEQIGQEMDDLRELAEPVLVLIGEQESTNPSDAHQHQKMSQLIQEQNFTEQHLRDKMGFTQESLDAFSKLSRFMYDVGQYDTAQKYLEHHAMMVENPAGGGGPGAAREVPKVFGVMWGKVAAELLQNTQYGQAKEDIMKLKDFIDGQLFLKPLEVLQQRAWLLHWCLFLLFFHPESYDSMIEIFYSQKYVEAMQTCCPWLIRYLSAAFVLHHQRCVILWLVKTNRVWVIGSCLDICLCARERGARGRHTKSYCH